MGLMVFNYVFRCNLWTGFVCNTHGVWVFIFYMALNFGSWGLKRVYIWMKVSWVIILLGSNNGLLNAMIMSWYRIFLLLNRLFMVVFSCHIAIWSLSWWSWLWLPVNSTTKALQTSLRHRQLIQISIVLDNFISLLRNHFFLNLFGFFLLSPLFSTFLLFLNLFAQRNINLILNFILEFLKLLTNHDALLRLMLGALGFLRLDRMFLEFLKPFKL